MGGRYVLRCCWARLTTVADSEKCQSWPSPPTHRWATRRSVSGPAWMVRPLPQNRLVRRDVLTTARRFRVEAHLDCTAHRTPQAQRPLLHAVDLPPADARTLSPAWLTDFSSSYFVALDLIRIASC